jgi:cell division protein FtsB
MSEITIEAERNLYKGKYRALLKLISRTRSQLVHVTDHIEDEGDRVYFGSTNDADALKALYHEMMSWIWDATDETNRIKADPYATIRDLRARIAALEAEFDQMVMECFEVVSTTDVDQNGDNIERSVPKHHLLAAEVARLEAENADLRSGSYLASVVEERDAALAALKEAHATLKTASRQLTEDHKMVLMGRGWGWRTLATIEGVIAKSEAKP